MLNAAALRASALKWACVAGMLMGTAPLVVQARESAPALATMTVAELPPQGQTTFRLIYQGGPFPYEKDGTVFGNRERILPPARRGYYREYTVKTPYARNRGARRIVCGGPATTPAKCFYTGDHYASFREIVQ
jgi:ribonuclease T1